MMLLGNVKKTMGLPDKPELDNIYVVLLKSTHMK